MANARERGFAFTRLPVVIDPIQPALTTKILTYTNHPDDLGDDQSLEFREITLHRVACDIVEFAGMNYYGESSDIKQCRFLLVYDSIGVLQRVMYYRDGALCCERFPEEFIGTISSKPSVRFVLNNHEEAEQLIDHLQQIHQLRRGQCSLEVGQQAATDLINLLLNCPEDPIFCPVALPTQIKEFTPP